VQVRAITWNLFHGRDAPPDPALFSWRSRLLGTTEAGSTHVQVNRDLLNEFSGLLASAEWDVALLQECPPRWTAPLADACEAAVQVSLTSHNSFAPLRAGLARRNPDLIASGEGGCNATLVRRTWDQPPVERRELELRRRPQRRTMAFCRLPSGLCIANLHTTNDRPDLAGEEVLRAAAAATGWAGSSPLLLGGDLNIRPGASSLFDTLHDRFGLAPPTGPDAIDHLLARGMATVEPPRQWPAQERDLPSELPGRAIRLSDHAPVSATFELPGSGD
jgi:endonuclease/exonuclease/phosphatase family metal-dependent hydrolase